MMKKFLLILTCTLVCAVCLGQYPIVEEFNPGTSWTFTNGAGIQNYGPSENYATMNIGTTPYPNNATVTITSPVYDFTVSCSSDITISFPISGVIENGFDFLYFEYFNAGAWVNLGFFTGSVTGTYTNTAIPNTTTQFRFRLVTDCSVNGYKGAGSPCSLIGYPTTCTPNPGNCNDAISVYYYDITRFTIDCATLLPIELLKFDGYNVDKHVNYLYWLTASEINNDYFTIERSRDGIFWTWIGKVAGIGNSSEIKNYYFVDDAYIDGVNYYRLSQTDFDGHYETFDMIVINTNTIKYEDPVAYYNLLGQLVDKTYMGFRILIYKDGTALPVQVGSKNPEVIK